VSDNSPEQRAVEEWFDSGEGETCCQGAASAEYLRNRLWRAFRAGMDAGKKIARRQAVEAFAKLIGEVRSDG
jgi:hypothetical protein